MFLVLGPTVFALHLTMLLFNVAAALLLWWLLIREARLTPGAAAMVVLPFALAPVVLSAHLIEAQGGNPEPFLWVGVLWVVRRRPLLLGALAAVAFLHREFTLYAIPALGVAGFWQLRLDQGGRDQWVAEIRHWLVTAFAFIVVFLSIQALKPAADLMGPATAGMRAPDRPQDNLTQLRNRIVWDPATIPARIAALPDELFAVLLGVKTLDPRVVAIGSRVPVGWPELAPLLAVIALVWPLALVPGARAPRGALIFPTYLVLIGVQSALVYAFTRDPSVHLLRYALLALLIPVAVSAMLLQPWRAWGVRLAATVLLALLAATAAIDHLRVLQQSYRGVSPLRFADAAARLVERGVPIGRAGYWRSYAITFLTRERVKLTSTDVLRIQEYAGSGGRGGAFRAGRAGATLCAWSPGGSGRRLVPLRPLTYTANLDLSWRRPLMLRFLLAFVLALGSALPAAAQSTAINGTIEGTVTDDPGRCAAGRHGHRHQHRHRRHARGGHQRKRPVSGAAAAARQLPGRGRAAGLQEVRAERRHAAGRPDGGDQRQARGRHPHRNRVGDRRFARRGPRQDRAGPHADRRRDQDAAADLAQPLQLRAAPARGRGVRDQRVRRAPAYRQRRAAPRELPDRRQQQHAEGSRRPAADADVRGDDSRSQGRHHRLCAGVRPDDGAGLQRDHAVGHQPVPRAGRYRFQRKPIVAMPFFSAANAAKPPTDIKVYTFDLGGPILRDKTHFFGGYENT